MTSPLQALPTVTGVRVDPRWFEPESMRPPYPPTAIGKEKAAIGRTLENDFRFCSKNVEIDRIAGRVA